MNHKARAFQRVRSEEIPLHNHRSPKPAEHSKYFAGGLIPHENAAPLSGSSGVLSMQRLIGNAAVQRMMATANKSLMPTVQMELEEEAEEGSNEFVEAHKSYYEEQKSGNQGYIEQEFGKPMFIEDESTEDDTYDEFM